MCAGCVFYDLISQLDTRAVMVDAASNTTKKSSSGSSTDTELVTHRLPSNGNGEGTFLGALAITIVLACMGLGPLVPALILWLGVWCSPTVAATAAALTAASMVTARHSPAFCRFFLRGAAWFGRGVFLHVERRSVAATASSPSIWCMHPHGTSIGFGFAMNGAVRFRTEQPDTYVPPELAQALTASRMNTADGVMAPLLFRVPFLRSVLLGFGCCTPATKEGMRRLLRQRVDFGILPGGMEEVALYTVGRDRVYISKRAGFIKYALQHGYCLLPAYTFGECDLYNSMTAGSGMRMWMQRHLGFVVPIFWGPLWFAPWLPRRDIPIHTVLGSPIQLPCIEEPSAEQVAKWHRAYIAALTEIFETHKGSFGYQDRTLEIL